MVTPHRVVISDRAAEHADRLRGRELDVIPLFRFPAQLIHPRLFPDVHAINPETPGKLAKVAPSWPISLTSSPSPSRPQPQNLRLAAIRRLFR